jgi:hypothetical protein
MDYHRCRSYKGAEELGIEPSGGMWAIDATKMR